MVIKRNFLDSKQLSHAEGRKKLTFGQKAADAITSFGGSWTFIFIFLIIILLWFLTNSYFLVQYGRKAFDPYPFILLNLVLSCLAAIQAPIILMSQNRASERDRLRAEYDYAVNRKAEKEIRDIKKDLEIIKKKLGVVVRESV
ncbi:MAG: DUF1003 domain-containing protein [Candidatus Pacearchaeota archaeon]